MLEIKEVREEIIPIKWKDWDEMDRLCNMYYYVTFLEDFGVFKKDEYYTDIFINYVSGLIEAYEDQKVIKSQHFITVPVLNICHEE